MANVKLTVTTNMDQASKDIKNLGKVSEEEFKRIKAAQAKITTEKITAFQEKTKRAGIAVAAVHGKVRGWKQENFRLQREIVRLINAGMDPLGKEVKKLSKRYDENVKSINADTKSIQQSEQAMKAAKVGAVALGVAVAAAAAFGTKSQADYAKELANVNTLLEITDAQFKTLDSSIESLSNTYAIQKKELGAGVYQAVSAGAETLNDALIIVNESAKLGKAALIDSAQSVDIITTAMNAYGKEVVDASKASDIYFNIIKKGKINGEQLSATIGQSIPLFASMNIEIEELGAGIATMTKLGVKASEATTQLNGIVNAFIKPSKGMEAALKRQGIASGSALLEQEGLAGAMAFLQKETGGQKEELVKLLPNIRAVKGAMALGAQEGKVFAESLKSFNDVSGVTDEALKKQTEGFAKNVFTVEQSIVALTNLAMGIGELVLPVLGKLASTITFLSTDLSKTDGKAQALKFTLLALALSVGGLVTVLFGIPALIGAVTTAWGVLSAALLVNPIFAVTAAAIAATAALGSLAIAIAANSEAASEASGSFAAMGEEGLQKVSDKLFAYQMLMRDSANWTKENKKEAKLLKKELKNLTGSKIKLNDVTREDGTVTKQATIEKHGQIQTVKSLDKRIATSILLKERATKATLAQLEIEKKADDETANLFKKKKDREEAQEKREAAALKKWEAGIEGAKQLRAQTLIDSTRISMTASEKEIDIIKREFEEKSNILKTYYANDTAALVALEQNRQAALDAVKSPQGDDESKILQDKLKTLSNIESQNLLDRTASYQQFLAMRVEQEGVDAENSIIFLEEQLARVKEMKTLSQQEEVAAEQATAEAIKKIRDKDVEDQKKAAKLKRDIVRATESGIMSILGETINARKKAGKEYRALAIAQKFLALAQIAINTALSISASAAIGYPQAIPGIIAAVATGVSSTIAVASTPIPSAQTGITNFTVPESRTTNRSDGVGLMVNPGEQVDVTPRGEEGGRDLTVIAKLNDEVLWESTQRGIDGGILTITNENIRAA